MARCQPKNIDHGRLGMKWNCQNKSRLLASNIQAKQQ